MVKPKTVNYFRKMTTLLKIFGVSFTGNESKAYLIYSKLYIYAFGLYIFLAIREIMLNELSAYIDYMVYNFAVVIVLVKIVVAQYKRLELGKILDKMNSEPFLPDAERGGDVEKKVIDECVFITNVQINLYWGMSISIVALTVLYTVYKRITSTDYHDWVLAYGPINILDVTKTPYYEITLIYQNLVLCSGVCLFTSVDLLIATVLAHITYQFQNLQNYLKGLVRMTYIVECKGSGSSDMINAAPRISWILLKKSYIKFIKYHLAIIDVAREMEKAFSVLVLMVYLGTIALLCFEIYRASVITNYLQLARTMGESVSFMVQIGLMSYWGEQVIFQSQLVANAAFETDFVGADIKFQKALLLTIIRCQRPVKLTAGKFALIQLYTFTWVVKTSYSAFMLIRTSQK